MPYRLSLLLVALIFLAAGCVRIPQPQGFPYSNQPKRCRPRTIGTCWPTMSPTGSTTS